MLVQIDSAPYTSSGFHKPSSGQLLRPSLTGQHCARQNGLWSKFLRSASKCTQLGVVNDYVPQVVSCFRDTCAAFLSIFCILYVVNWEESLRII